MVASTVMLAQQSATPLDAFNHGKLGLSFGGAGEKKQAKPNCFLGAAGAEG
jgi:hypothetical protein